MIFFRKERKIPHFDLKMFPNILRKIDYHEETFEDDNEALFELDEPSSPGMILFLDEEDSRPRKMKANVKYNKAFEATKILTQFLAQVNNEDFLDQIKMVNQLT